MMSRALLVVPLCLAACEATSRRFAALDAPPPAPVAVGEARPLAELKKVTELSEAEKAKQDKEMPECGRGSGATSTASACRSGCGRPSTCSGSRSPAACS
ncbi:hypothetical protein OV079_26790 [Nannocystis pusilla]|uniref:Uncharacterized protein n=1 Tax=Nannocystis pusilla TaxID=889268 RepID=A0A9X3ETR0_9BACT|nr:hypothetical protein [Nannocystis pusilla]MCY1009105.1 hypothetical protein [Nannocystis pusilla]